MTKKYRYRLCCVCGKPGTSKSVKPTDITDPTAPWAHPACWQKELMRRKKEERERQRQVHLAVKNWWVDGPPRMESSNDVPGSGAYNIKYGFER